MKALNNLYFNPLNFRKVFCCWKNTQTINTNKCCKTCNLRGKTCSTASFNDDGSFFLGNFERFERVKLLQIEVDPTTGNRIEGRISLLAV